MQNILKGKYGVHSHSSIIGRQKTVNVYSCFLKLVIIRVSRSSIKCLLCQALLFRVSPINNNPPVTIQSARRVKLKAVKESISWPYDFCCGGNRYSGGNMNMKSRGHMIARGTLVSCSNVPTKTKWSWLIFNEPKLVAWYNQTVKTATSLYLNQCWIFISKVHWHSSETNFTIDSSAISH